MLDLILIGVSQHGSSMIGIGQEVKTGDLVRFLGDNHTMEDLAILVETMEDDLEIQVESELVISRRAVFEVV